MTSGKKNNRTEKRCPKSLLGQNSVNALCIHRCESFSKAFVISKRMVIFAEVVNKKLFSYVRKRIECVSFQSGARAYG